MTTSESRLEEDLLRQLRELKYTHRPDIRDRASLEANFREKFQALNQVKLTEGEFRRLLDEIITPDVFTAAKTLRGMNDFTRDDGTPLNYTLVNIKDWCKNNRLPTIIYEKGIANLKISVGSEIAMMLKPNVHWIGNKRTVWAHLLVRHEMNEATANEALRLYYDGDDESPMAYNIWRDLYLAVGPDLVVLGQQASVEAERQNVQPGTLRYLWADAVSTFLFDRYVRH